ncbi:MAG TPA: hypothetical protein V6C69_17025 [Trichormus sp.]
MLPKQVRRPVRAVFNLLTASALILGQTPALAAEIGTSVFGPEGQDSFLISQKQLVKQWLKPAQYMPVSEIKPGMEGYGLSVFQGTKPERFNFKVVGVVKKVLNGRDAILVHLAGPQLGRCNVVRGMSGSPLYINNRLIGAISYGFDFSMEPIAGVTPIADMLDALSYEESPNHEVPPNRIGALPSQALPPDAVRSIQAAGGGGAVTQVSGGAPHLVPLMAPVSLAGFSPRAQEFLSGRMQSQGMWCGSGAGGALDPSLAKLHAGTASAKDLVPPGGAISVMLTTGDFNSSACGTATATFGNHVLAFGHPFMSAGTVQFPMATAYIHQVLPNYSVSFKVASPMQVIGSFEADRPWAVSGEIGKTAKMIPVTYTVTDETRHIKRVYHANVVDHPDLTPELVAATAMSAIDTTHQSSGPYVLKVKSNIDATGIGAIERTDRYSSNFTAHGGSRKIHFGISDPVGSYLMGTTARIMDNEFEQASIKSVNLDISLQDGHDGAKIERVYLDKPFVAPGETLDVHCVLHPYNHALITKTLKLQVPRDVPDGNILVGVSSGDDIDYVRKRLGLIDPPAENLDQIAKKIRDAGSGDNLTAVLALPHQSILVGGTVLPDPPAHWAKLFFSDRYTRGPSLVKAEVRSSQPQEYLIDGSHILTVEVRRPDKALTRSQPYLATASGSYAGSDGLFMTDLARKTMDSSHKSELPGSSLVGGTIAADKPAAAQTFWTSTKDYPHMRSLLVWQQESNADFNQGKTDSTTIDSWGRITPALQDVAQKSIANDMRIWSATWAAGNFWFATGDKVYRWKGDDSAPVAVAKVKGLAIPTMTVDSTGTIYFSSVPGGEIMAINGNAKGDEQTPHSVAKLTEQIITCMCVDQDDNLYAGVAGSGKVYKLPPGQKDRLAPRTASMLFDSGQADVTCLFYSQNDKRLYIGTAERGDVYSIDAAGAVKAEYQSPDHIVTGIVRDSKGDLYVATAASGHLFKLAANGAQTTLATSEAFYTLLYDRATDTVYSGDGEGDITQAQTDPLSHDSYFVPVSHTEEEAVLALASDGKGKLFCGTSNLAVARTFEMKPASPAVYTSIVKDAGRKAKWSRLRAFGAYNEVSDLIARTVQVESRSGEISQPDETWSNWLPAKYSDEAYVLASPPGRYMQYRLTWRPDTGATKSSAHAKAPVSIGKVEVTYQPTNVAPEFTSISLKTGTACSAKQDVSVVATDPDGDNLALSIEASADGAKTWIPLVANLRSHHPSKDAHAAGDKAAESKKRETNSESHKPNKEEQKEEPKERSAASNQKDTDVATPSNPHLGYESENSSGADAVELDADKPADPDADKDKDKDKEKDKDADKENKEAKHEDKGDADKSASDDKGAKDKVIVKETKAADKLHSKAKLPSGQPLAQLKAAEPSTTGEKFTWNWDTAKLKDGNYVVKMTLDDVPSNPAGHLQTVALRTIEVDNSPPEITLLKLTKGKDRAAGSLSVKAHDKFTPIVNATYRFDDGEPFALGNPDNITDGLDAEFAVNDLTIPHGSHKLEVQVTNEAGNTATKTINVN